MNVRLGSHLRQVRIGQRRVTIFAGRVFIAFGRVWSVHVPSGFVRANLRETEVDLDGWVAGINVRQWGWILSMSDR